MKKLSNNLAMYICMFVAVFCAMTLKAEAANVTSDTLGDNDGITWTYNADTKTLTITGEDSGLEGGYDSSTHEYISQFVDICGDVETIKVQNCTMIGSTRAMFAQLDSLKTIEFTNVNTSNGTDMSHMFAGCSSLSSLDLSSFNTTKVTSMGHMFYKCSSLSSLNLSSFNTQNVKDMQYMFANCSNLSRLNLGDFNNANTTFMGYMFYKCSSLSNLDLSNFKTPKVSGMGGMFLGCSSLSSLDLSSFNTESATNMSDMFNGCSNLTSVDLSGFNTSKVNNMSYMFYGCSSLTDLNLSKFDTTNVTNMRYMFSRCANLESVDVSAFDTSNVTAMDYMFNACSGLKSLNVSNFDTSKVQNFMQMFYECEYLKTLDISSFEFTSVADERNVQMMLGWCNSLETIKTPKSVGDFSINLPYEFSDAEGNVADAITGAFCNKTLKKLVVPVSSIQLNVKNTSLRIGQSIQVKATVLPANASNKEVSWESSDPTVVTVDENGKITGVAPGYVTITATAKDGSGVSASCKATVSRPVTGITLNKTSVDLRAGETCVLTAMVTPTNASDKLVVWKSSDTSVATVSSGGKVTAVAPGTVTITATARDGYGASASCDVTVISSTSGYLGDNDGIYWTYDPDTKTLSITGKDSGFEGVWNSSKYKTMSPFVELCDDVEVIKIENCTPIGEITGVFAYLESLKRVEFKGFDTSQVTNMSDMFNNCSNLTDLDVSGFDTTNVTDMGYMFYGCESLTDLDVSSFDTANVTDIEYMFYGCESLTDLDVSSFDTANVTDMGYLFYGCKSLTDLDVRGFNTSCVTDMGGMFGFCEMLSSLEVSNFDTAKVISMTAMFQGCRNLISLDLSNFNTANVEFMPVMFNMCESLISLDLSSFDLSKVKTMSSALQECGNLTIINTPKAMADNMPMELPGTFADLSQKQTTSLTKEFCNTTLINVNNLVTGVSVAPASVELKPGETKQLQATVAPSKAAIKEVTWKSSNTAVATVDATGKVTAVGEGTATITATAKDGTDVSASCEVTVTEPVKEPVPETPESQVRAFVERMYTVALGRAAEAEGLNFYVQRLFAGDSNGACLAESFLCSPEFLNKGHSDAEYVKVLYRTFFDREPAAEEVNYWVNKLAAGETKAFVLSGFVNSYEFDNLCISYGISRGFMREDGKPLNPGIGRFAERMYTVVLERAGEKEGIEYWSLSIANGVCTPKDAAKNFFLSPEYVNKNTSDAQYITTLYKAFMDREPEAGGVEYWQNVLKNGATREQILEGFADSAEFKGIMASFGL